MFRSKKGSADNMIEFIVFIFFASMIFYFLFFALEIKDKEVKQGFDDLKMKSYANSLLVGYLDDSISGCISENEHPSAQLLKDKGDLSYADLINLIFIGRLQASFSHMDYGFDISTIISFKDRIYYLFFDQDEPYDDYEDIWRECTAEYFDSKNFGDYRLKVFYQDSEVFGSDFVDYTKYIISGEAELPNFADKANIIQVQLFEVSKE